MEPEHILRDLKPGLLFEMNCIVPAPSINVLHEYLRLAIINLIAYDHMHTPSTRVTACIRIAALALSAAASPNRPSCPASREAEKTNE